MTSAQSSASSSAPVGTLTKGIVSPHRSVPDHIQRPNYVGLDAPPEYTGPDVFDAETVEKIRRAGQLAADAMVATGRLDAYYERGLKPWDHAAGALIAEEAGAVVASSSDDAVPTTAAAPGVVAGFLAALGEYGGLSS